MWPFERGLAPSAERQLAAWQEIGMRWKLRLDGRSWCCQECGKGVYLDMDDLGRTYIYTPEQKTAAIVLHLRNHHPDLDPELPRLALSFLLRPLGNIPGQGSQCSPGSANSREAQ